MNEPNNDSTNIALGAVHVKVGSFHGQGVCPSSKCLGPASRAQREDEVRVDELNALTAALEILKSEVVSGNSTAFFQLATRSSPKKQHMESLARKVAEEAKHYGQHATGSQNMPREQKIEQHLALPAQHQKVLSQSVPHQALVVKQRTLPPASLCVAQTQSV